MSGWIKWEKDLKDDPRVLKMARQFRNADVTHVYADGVYVAIVLGGLTQLWCYADTHIRNDDTIELGVDDINEVVGIKGFAQMLPEDWLQVIDAETVKIPGFHRHNGTEAKKKALTQKRVAKHRETVTLDELKVQPRCNAPVTLDALPDQDQDQDQDQSMRKSHAPLESETEVAESMRLIRAKYPTPARADWITAEKNARNLVLNCGVMWPQLVAGVERYAKCCLATNRMSLNPARFFGDIDRPWSQDWPIQAPKDHRTPAPNHDAAWAEAKQRAGAIDFREPWPQESPGAYMTAIKLAENAPRNRPDISQLTNKMRMPA